MGEREYAEEVHAHCRFGQAFVWDDEGEGGKGGEEAYPMELHGVVYRITLRDWELIVHSEVCFCTFCVPFFLYIYCEWLHQLGLSHCLCFSSVTKSREHEEM